MAKTWLIVPLLVLYLSTLGGVGFLSTDEPRYASIGREMARSGDWITPRLDGKPWFEKPPLLYWTTALGLKLHLPDEWAARLPLALISLAFLIFFYETLEREFSERVAIAATGILATSAGWMAYTFVAVTDLPMSAALGAAMLIALFDTRPGRGWIAGVFLGLAILAKGFVPVVLFAPLLLVIRGKRLVTVAASLAVAAPWYIACELINGRAFWNEFFWKQQVERFLHPTLDHVQPVWYYIPVLLGLLFPWTPLAALLFRPKTYQDLRIRSLLLFLVFGFIFFSAAMNKLPGYVLPLMPALAIILAVALDKVGRSGNEEIPGRPQSWWLAACALLLVAIPAIGRSLPDALLSGITRIQPSYALALPFVAAAVLVWVLAWTGRAHLAVLTTALAAAVGAGYLKTTTFPVLDQKVSTRAFWVANQEKIEQACVANLRRDWRFGLNYYASHPLPDCDATSRYIVSGEKLLQISQPPPPR